MKRNIHLILFGAIMACSNLSLAQNVPSDENAVKPSAPAVVLPPGITEEMLAPPPVPRFMLEKPAKPLTMNEMIQQTRQAESQERVRQTSGKRQGQGQAQTPENSTH